MHLTTTIHSKKGQSVQPFKALRGKAYRREISPWVNLTQKTQKGTTDKIWIRTTICSILGRWKH